MRAGSAARLIERAYGERLDANPLHYDVERHGERRAQISPWLDSTDSDLGAFRERGGRLILIVGTDDTLAPSGEQLDYCQSVLERMGRDAVDDAGHKGIESID